MDPARRLPQQVPQAFAELLRGFSLADDATHGALLRGLSQNDDVDDHGDHVGRGLRAVVLRLVFLLLASARGLPSSSSRSSSATTTRTSVAALFERLGRDAARAPSTMSTRYGAWARLLVLFRRVPDDQRGGGLFDPDAWPFLEGRLDGRSAGALPRVPDDVVLRVLSHLCVVDGQRVDHGALDVEVLGAAYEQVRGLAVRRATETTLLLGPRPVVVGVDSLLALPGDARASWLREHARVTLSARAATRLQSATHVDDVVDVLARRVSALSPRPVPRGALHLAPTDARRRAGMHYTPRALTTAVVRATLQPLVDALGPRPHPEQLLGLTVCDPAMGAGAFLVEACRQLAAHLVTAQSAHGDGVDDDMVARRQIARRCLYGVDVDDTAAALARLSLWLVAGARDEALTFVDAQLRCGDALVGCSRAQIERFDWNAPTRDDTDVATTPLDDGARAALQKRGDALVDVFFAHDRVRAREAARKAARASDLFVDASTRTRPTRAVHWELSFPAVFGRERPGFDAVVGNPPFLNAIEARGARTAAQAAFYALSFPTFAQGAYDLSVLFLARTTTTLLRRGGRYGLLVPLVLLSADRPWRPWMHAHWRPDALFAWPVDQFDGAAIRVVALVGGAGTAATAAVTVVDDGASHHHVHRFVDGDDNWYAALSPPCVDDAGLDDDDHAADDDGVLTIAPVPLGARFGVSAGCATAVAYALRPLVVDVETSSSSSSLQLVTTGALDRFRSRWGDTVVRFLKRDFVHPRWPAGAPPAVPADVARARDAQRRPKVLVGGLTAVIEAWLDDDGSAGGVVSTWVLTPRAPVDDDARSLARLKALTVLVNAASFSRAFLRLHGAGAMSGRQTTIKKAALLSSAIPDVFVDERGFAPDAFSRALHDLGVPSSSSPPPRGFVAQLAALHERLAHAPSREAFHVVDAFAHVVVARLFGRTRRAAVSDARWWYERVGRDPGAVVDVDAVVARVWAVPFVRL